MLSVVTQSGLRLEFKAYDANLTTWNEVAGLYMFGKPIGLGSWELYYIGKTENFRQRLANHEHWPHASRLGCATILATVVPNTAMRGVWEEELIQRFRPTLNTQLKPAAASVLAQGVARNGLFSAR